jgi:hypothetical protein
MANPKKYPSTRSRSEAGLPKTTMIATAKVAAMRVVNESVSKSAVMAILRVESGDERRVYTQVKLCVYSSKIGVYISKMVCRFRWSHLT